MMNNKLIPMVMLAICLLSACTTPPPTFIGYAQDATLRNEAAGTTNNSRNSALGRRLNTKKKFNPISVPKLSDAIAINYANEIETIFRWRAAGKRYTRETSRTALMGLSAITAASQTLKITASKVAKIGLASSGIVEIQNIFDAKSRSRAYMEAAQRIHDAIKDYGAHQIGGEISDAHITPNGWTLVNIVQSNIDMVESVLAGSMPTAEDMIQATEPMSDTGAIKQATTTPVNNIEAIRPTAATLNSSQLAAINAKAQDIAKVETTEHNIRITKAAQDKADKAIFESWAADLQLVDESTMTDNEKEAVYSGLDSKAKALGIKGSAAGETETPTLLSVNKKFDAGSSQQRAELQRHLNDEVAKLISTGKVRKE